MSFFEELKRRNVVRVGIAYAVSTWILLQLTDVVAEILQLPEWAPKLILLILVVGFVPALIFAWAFEMTPDGIVREKDVDRSESITPRTGRKLDYTIIGLLALGMAYFIWEARFKETAVIPANAGTSQSSDATNQIPASAGMTDQNVSAETSQAEAADDAFSTDKSIAVLPFTNRSPDANDAYFTDGVHDDLLTQLAKIEAFSVISRTSVMEYRDTAKNLKQIGEELGVANIMEGAVQRAGNRVRINVQLIDAISDEHLWAEVYDRELTTENLFDIQSEIAQAIANALHATLSDTEIANVADVPTDNVAAYELYLQAKRFTLGETEIGYDTAVDLYTEALSLDPKFKLAWVGLAQAHINNYWSYGGKVIDRQKTREAIDKAREIDPDFPELYMAEGFYHYWGLLDYDTAITYLEKAIEMMPGNAEAHMWKGWASRRGGYWEQAVAAMQQSLKLNPRVVINWTELGQTLAYRGAYDEAVAAAEQGHKVNPDNYWGKTELARLLIMQSGDTKRATTLVIGAQHANESSFTVSYWEAMLMDGQFDAALKTAREWPRDWEIAREAIGTREQYVADTLMAMDRKTDAQAQARLSLQQLDTIKSGGINDYRIHAAELRARAILEDKQNLQTLKQRYLSSRPIDVIEAFIFEYSIAISYAFAGMNAECIETLDQLLSGSNNISIPWVKLDPRLNSVHSDPAFIAMLERHR
jgi:TolB-like protein/cytochrome c-type biogenesis protein CcmH/NrfG